MSYNRLEAQCSLTRQLNRAAVRRRHDDDSVFHATSRRARLVSQICFPPREFSRCLRSHCDEQPCLGCKAHSRALPHRLVRTFPSMVPNLRWNPYVETVTDVQTDDFDPYYQFDECEEIAYPSPPMGPSPLKNVTSFCNQCTMTPRVADASCGICRGVAPPPPVSEAGVTAARNTRDRGLTCKRAPSILRRTECSDAGECLPRRRVRHCVQQEPVRDIDQDEGCVSPAPSCTNSSYEFCKPLRRDKCPADSRSSSARSSCQRDQDSEDERRQEPRSCVRRPLYNEGISDSVAECIPQYSHDCRDEGCNNKYQERCWPQPDNYIPYSHTFKSKYHHHCQEKGPRRYRACTEPELQHMGACPRSIMRRAVCGPPARGCSGRHVSPPRGLCDRPAAPCSPRPAPCGPRPAPCGPRPAPCGQPVPCGRPDPCVRADPCMRPGSCARRNVLPSEHDIEAFMLQTNLNQKKKYFQRYDD